MSRTKCKQKHAEIVKIAKRLFLAQGFASVSMDLISKESGVSKNTLYSHFLNKEDLFSFVLQSHWEDDDKPDLDPNDPRELKVILNEYATLLMTYLYKKETLGFFRLLAHESNRLPSLAGSIITDELSPSSHLLTRYFMQSLRKDESQASSLAIIFLGLLKEDPFWHVLVGFRKPYSKKQLKEHIEKMVNIFLTLLES